MDTHSDVVVGLDHVSGFDFKDECFSGYRITTTRQQIKVFVSTYTSCCENAGTALLKPEGLDLLGARVLSVAWGRHVKNGLVAESLDTLPEHFDDVQRAVVDVMTDRGLVQLVAFNEHNGYYPHSVYTLWAGHEDLQEI